MILNPKNVEHFLEDILNPSPILKQKKALPMVTEQMNASYEKRTLSNWHLRNPALEEIRKEEYGAGVRSEKSLVEA